MGVTYLNVLVKRLPDDPTGEELEFLVDTGATSLEAMGLMIDPLSRDLRQHPAMLARWTGR